MILEIRVLHGNLIDFLCYYYVMQSLLKKADSLDRRISEDI